MRPLLVFGLLFGAAYPPLVAGQQQLSGGPAAPEIFGTVTGSVLCADTQRPARSAFVSFIPIPAAPPPGKPVPAIDLQTAQPPVRTDMAGRFSQPKLKPGRYYVNIALDGYLTPILELAPDLLQHPSPETQKRLRDELTEVTVQPNRSTQVQLTLFRGASVSGTVLYDDGTPAISMAVELLGKDPHGRFTISVNNAVLHGLTDAHGRFDLVSVPAGEYVLLADLNVVRDTEVEEQLLSGQQIRASLAEIPFNLPIYFGDVLRLRDAVPITLSTAETRSGLVISVPLSRFHEVSGTLLAPDGHPLSGGTVQLRYPDDDSVFLSVAVTRDNGRFLFNYTPEGSYTLTVEGARDVAVSEATAVRRGLPGLVNETTLRTYGTTRQPLLVKGDRNDLLLTLPNKASDPDVAPSTAARP